MQTTQHFNWTAGLLNGLMVRNHSYEHAIHTLYKSHSPVLVKGPPQLCDNLWDKSMPCLSNSEREITIGQLQAGVNQNVIVTTFGVSQPTNSSL